MPIRRADGCLGTGKCTASPAAVMDRDIEWELHLSLAWCDVPNPGWFDGRYARADEVLE
jgi:hypothetical protein